MNRHEEISKLKQEIKEKTARLKQLESQTIICGNATYDENSYWKNIYWNTSIANFTSRKTKLISVSIDSDIVQEISKMIEDLNGIRDNIKERRK